ncbi:MAG TPA: hypothetical protein VGW12_07610 [Pyrinomonadaceae bacterium]|nr:hypothetical protein [Pyrinomonadaceae bacterium]
MKLNLPKFERLHILIITLLVLLIPFSLYYWGFVRLQTTYFTEHKSRQLAVMSNQISAKLKNLGGVVDNAAIKLFEDATEARKKGQKKLEDSKLEDFGKRLMIGDQLEPPQSLVLALPKSTNAKPSVKDITFTPEYGSDVSKLLIRFTGGWDDGSPEQSLKVEANLGEVLKHILSKEAFESILIADAETGEVVHQHNRRSGAKLRVATLNALRDEQNKEIYHHNLAKATNIQDVKLAGVGYKLFSRPVEVGVTVPGSKRPSLRWIVCGLISERQFSRECLAISYTVLIVFTVVMILAAISWVFLKLWLMGAKDRLRVPDAYFLAFSAVIGAALLTLFSLYSYTYISLSHDADDKLEEFAQVVHNNLREEVRTALDELDRLNEELLADADSAKLIAREFEAKDQPAGNALKTASQLPTLEKKAILPQLVQTDEARKRHPYPFFTTAFWVDEKRRQRIKWTTRDVTTHFITLPLTFDFFKNIKDERFLHLKKGSTDRPTGNESDAPPPNGPQETCRNDNQRAAHHDFWLEPLTSPLAGVETVVISKRLCAPYSDWVAALDTRLLSVLDTVVTPPGYGFSVIETNGRMLFHSKITQHFEENFYDESDQRAELRAAVEARQSERISTDYLGSGHTLYTLPVQGFPEWTIITYRDKQILRTMQLELLVVAANLFLIYSLLLLLVFVGVYLWKVNMNKRFEWVWPRDEAVTLYRRLLAFNVVCSLLFSIAISAFQRSTLFWLAVLIPFSALGVIAFSLKRSSQTRKVHGEHSDSAHPLVLCRPWYVWMVTTMMFLISVLPAIAFFKLAHDEQMKLFAKHGQVKLAEDLRKRELRIKELYADYLRNAASQSAPAAGETKDSWLKEVIDRRLTKPLADFPRPLDVYESVLLDTKRETTAVGGGSSSPPPTRAAADAAQPNRHLRPLAYENYLSYLRPIVNRMSGEWAGLIEARSTDNAWEWGEAEGNRLLLRTRETDMAEHAAPLQLSSDVPLLSKVLWPEQRIKSAFWLLSLAAVLALLFFLMRFVVVRIFLLNLDDPATMLYTNEFRNSELLPKRFVVLGAPFLNVSRLVDESVFKRISMEDSALWQNGGAEQEQQTALAGAPLAIVNFDYQSDDPEWNLRRLELLERLKGESHPVIVFSRHDPFRFCLTSSCAESRPHAKGAFPVNATDRWMNVVSSFWVIHIEDRGEWETFKQSLDQHKAEQVSSNGHGHGRIKRYLPWPRPKLQENGNHFAPFYQALAEECGPRAYLQNVGKGILKHPMSKKLSSEQLVRLLVEQAEAYYKAVWANCTADQKLTLYYLAQDRLVSAKNVEVRRLMRRGLIVRDPDVRLMNESFRQFVLSTVVPDEIGALERTGSSWSKLRLPLLLILVGIALFLLVTHPEMYSSSMAIITALATGIPAVFQLLGMFQRGKPGAAELAQLPGSASPPTG